MKWTKDNDRFRCLLGAVVMTSLLLSLAIWTCHTASAQGGGQPCVWSEPINLSETPDQDSRHGAIVGDPYGQVHAFWTETYGEPGQGRDYIAYRHTTDGQWSPTADILLSPPNGWASTRNGDVLADSERLYLAWEDNQGINVSIAPIASAHDARGWSTTRLFSGPTVSPAIAQASDGTLHVLFVGSQYMSLFHTFSTDAGMKWSEPIEVGATASSDQAVALPSLSVGPDGLLHATWQVNARSLDWTPSGIRYAQSPNNGLTWTNPIEFEEAAGGDPFVYEEVYTGRIHLMWNGRAGALGGRFYAWSDDRGSTWSSMQRRGDYWGGLNGIPSAFTDSLGRLVVMFTAAVQSAEHHTHPLAAFLTGTALGPPALIPEKLGLSIRGDAPAFGITGGNHLHALLWTHDELGEILYADCRLDAPQTTLMPTPLPVVRVPTPAPTVQSPQLARDTETPARSDNITVAASFDHDAVPKQGILSPIIFSLIASLIIIATASGLYLRNRKGRK